MKEQPIPAAALRDPGATEIARIWVAEHGLHCGLCIGLYEAAPIDEAQAWGVMLADLLRHLGRGLSAYYRRDPGEVIDTLLGAMRDELAAPSTPVEGDLTGPLDAAAGGPGRSH